MQRGFSGVLILFVGLLLAAGGAGGYYFYNQQKPHSVNSFEECAMYFPVMESYPEQCNTSDGKHFVQRGSEKETNIFSESEEKELPQNQLRDTSNGSDDFNLPGLFQGPRWESTVSAELTFMSDPGVGTDSVTLDGYRVQGYVNEKLAKAKTGEFIDYYETELKKLGWNVEQSSWADGIDGHSRTYRKGNVYLTIGYRGELEDPGGLRFGGDPQKVKGTVFTVEYAISNS